MTKVGDRGDEVGALTAPDEQKYSPRLSAAASMRSAFEAVFAAAPADATT